MLLRIISVLVLVLCLGSSFAQEDGFAVEGFTKELVTNEINRAVGIKFAEDGTGFIWTQDGQVYARPAGGEVNLAPILNISEEVNSGGDHGMLGFAIDPDFENNGFVYCLYVVDKHHWLFFGTPQYDPQENIFGEATFGRISRFTVANAGGDFSIDPNSKFVLLGATPAEGIPVLHTSHGVGSMVFGEDGTLMISTGDGSTWEGDYIGNGPPYFGSDVPGALEHGILENADDAGVYRAQVLETLSGKILRIDPTSGEGLPSNPFYEVANPSSKKSKVWALGLRNPFKMNIRPGFGSSDPSEGNPGQFILGNVGSSFFEEINICTGPGQNFGWPQFEGSLRCWFYANGNPRNEYASNPLFGEQGCVSPYFKFEELVKLPRSAGNYFANPCDLAQQITTAPVFDVKMPSFSYTNENNWIDSPWNGWTYEFDETGAIADQPYTDPSSGEVIPFSGFAGIAGDVYEGTSFPQEFHGLYFHADFKGWLHGFEFSESGEFILMQRFLDQPNQPIVHCEYNAQEDALFVIEYPAGIQKIYFGENPDPVAEIIASEEFGPSPLAVSLDGSGSSSPSGQALTYKWYIENDIFTDPLVNYTFQNNAGQPEEITVSLVVFDEENRKDSTSLAISLNNTPPSVSIATIVTGELYPIDLPSTIPLSAYISDAEFEVDEMDVFWQSILYHNTHFHIEANQSILFSQGEVPSVGCGNETYAYAFGVEVEDGAGLTAEQSVRLEPYCGGEAVPFFRDFIAEIQPNSNFLQWEVSNAERTEKIVIYRGTAQNYIFPIDTIYNISSNTISYTDFDPVEGDNFYVGKLFTPENAIRFSFARKITNFNFTEESFIYPNPVQGQANYYINGVPGKYELILTNTLGQIVFAKLGETETGGISGALDTSQFRNGIYHLSVVGLPFDKTIKVMVQHIE